MPAPRAGASDPTFDRLGSVTAGNASSINDGAAAVMMMSEAKAQELNFTCTGPYSRLCQRSGSTLRSWGLRQYMRPAAALSVWAGNWLMLILSKLMRPSPRRHYPLGKCWRDERRVNVNGGAIALGHPIGASGCRILVSWRMKW